MIFKWMSFIILSQAVHSIVIPKDPNEGPPVATLYRPPVYPVVPIRIGERRGLKSFKISSKLIHYLCQQDVIITITGASCPASPGPGCRPSATECRRRTMGSTSSQGSLARTKIGRLCKKWNRDLRVKTIIQVCRIASC